ncbi:MAG: multidrug efflux RND transporter permease subunit [Legionellales bacterium]|jgi:hydrophobe/amphiphile efflux-1 (HAE1) family protein
MNLSEFFIHRPRFAIVISALFILAGIIALKFIPAEQFPDITPPQVQVAASYPGASAEVIESTVAMPIEEQVNGVDNMLYMSSTSDNNGNYLLTVTFAVGTDPDINTINVQNRLQLAEPRLPDLVRRIGISVTKQSAAFLTVISIVSPNQTRSPLYLSNYATINVIDALKRVHGVGNASIFGPLNYALRIWLNPERMTTLGITTTDVVSALSDQNIQASIGQIGGPPFTKDNAYQYTLQAHGRLKTPEEFEQVVIKTGAGNSITKLKDIATVELGSESYSSYGELNGVASANIGVYLSPGANALQVVKDIQRVMVDLEKQFPEDVAYKTPYDTTLFVKLTIEEVIMTLVLTFFIVVLVTYVFLGDWRATLIPTLAIPVSLIGVFALLFALGYSINTITLFALVLAIGLVVDDAIVVVENVSRLLKETDMTPKQAAIQSMKEITGPIIATTLVLLAVFVPVAFFPGIQGQLYRQFAVTISGTVFISGIVALTLSPALCAIILRKETPPIKIIKYFQNILEKVRQRYVNTVHYLLERQKIVGIGVLLSFILFAFIYPRLPSGFLPTEDTGIIFIHAQLPDAASLSRTQTVIKEIESVLANTPGIQDVFNVNGFDILNGSNAPNTGLVIAVLKDLKQRPKEAQDFFPLLNKLRGQMNQIPSANIFVFTLPAISGLGTTSGFDFWLQDISGQSPEELSKATRAMLVAANQDPQLTAVFSSFNTNTPQIFVDINVDKAKILKVDLSDIYNTLQAQFGSFYINDFNYAGRVFQVIMQAQEPYRQNIDRISQLFVRSSDGQMVSLGTLVSIKDILGPQTISRYNLFRASLINGEAAHGYSSGDAITAMSKVVKNTLPSGFSYSWSALSFQEVANQSSGAVVFIIAIIFAYLFLVANYESFGLPLAVLLSVGVAMLGATLGIAIGPIDNNIYAQIGLVLLIALASKNAILIVEYANQLHKHGKDLLTASSEAAQLRFRAVVMTAFSFIFGVLPLVFATGAGAISRQSIGITVFAGMLAATVIGILCIPVLFCMIQKTSERWFSR